MEKIISYEDLPFSNGESLYFRMETDPKLYLTLLSKGYRIIKDIKDATNDTIYVTGRRQDYGSKNFLEYKEKVDNGIQNLLKNSNITKPSTLKFNYNDLINYKYDIPFVLKNENQNGGREKFLVNTEEDYQNLIKACNYLIEKNYLLLSSVNSGDLKYIIDYNEYLNFNFTVQEYINTPSTYNTTVRLLTTPSNDLLYASLKYNESIPYVDDTTLLGYLLGVVYPLSTKSIVSNTISGGKNILLGEDNYNDFENTMLDSHHINDDSFNTLVDSTKKVHNKFKSELGIICGFDYIYDKEKNKWFLLEYHSRPMVGDYSKRQGILYDNEEERLTAEGRVRATSLSLVLNKK